MRVLDSSPTPYRVRFEDEAQRHVASLDPAERERLNRALLQLADLAAFGVAYSISAGPIEKLFADVAGFSIRYQVDDEKRVLAVFAITTS